MLFKQRKLEDIVSKSDRCKACEFYQNELEKCVTFKSVDEFKSNVKYEVNNNKQLGDFDFSKAMEKYFKENLAFYQGYILEIEKDIVYLSYFSKEVNKVVKSKTSLEDKKDIKAESAYIDSIQRKMKVIENKIFAKRDLTIAINNVSHIGASKLSKNYVVDYNTLVRFVVACTPTTKNKKNFIDVIAFNKEEARLKCEKIIYNK